MPLRSASKGRDALVGSSCAGQGPLAVETGEDAEGVNALRDPAAQGDVAVAQPQHLHPLDDPRVARRAGRPQRVMRSGNPQVQRNLAGRVVGHGPRIVMVRPILGVVIIPLEEVDFVLRLDVAMLGHAHVDADRRAIDVFPIQSGVGDGLVGAVDADAAGPGAAPQVLAALVAEFVEIADPRHRGAEVADLVRTTPLRPANRFWRNSGSELPLGEVRPTPVITTRSKSGPLAIIQKKVPQNREVAVGWTSPAGRVKAVADAFAICGPCCSPPQYETNKPNRLTVSGKPGSRVCCGWRAAAAKEEVGRISSAAHRLVAAADRAANSRPAAAFPRRTKLAGW